MIIDTSQGNIETYGGIKEFKTSIDPKNLEFITTLLSSNLYSDPEQSFIREIVSNAWDSHVEAGTTETPVIIKFTGNNQQDYSVTIRDYGTGLSPERFKEVYCNIGSSTKRESNDFIGGFGIGKYSALACSNTVYITSYYEGTAYYYVMVKSGNSIITNLFMEKPTTEKNGVEVTIKNIENINPYIKALDYIVFFPNVYVDYPKVNLNSAKLKRFTNFAAATIRTESKLLLGNVLYPCNDSLLSFDSKTFLRAIEYTGIVIRFEVGEINITPNRESIIYTSDTIKKIEARIKSAKDELDKMIDAKITKDYDNLEKYYKAMSTAVYYMPVTDELISGYGYECVGYRVKPDDIKSTSITYNGTDLKAFLNDISSLLNLQLPNFKGVIYDDKIYQKRCLCSYRFNNKIKADKIVMLNEGTRLTNSVRIYLRENWDGYAVVTYFTLDEFKDYIKKELTGIFTMSHVPQYTIIMEGAYNALLNKVEQVDLDSDDTYLKIKEELSVGNLGTVATKEAILYVYDTRILRKEKMNFKKFSQALNYIKNLRQGVILANMDDDEFTLWNVAQVRGLKLIKARKDIVSDLKALKLSCIVNVDWLMNDDPVIRTVAAIRKSFPEGMNISCVERVCENISQDLAKEFKRVMAYYCKYGVRNGTYYELASRVADKGKCDPYTMYICGVMKNYIDKQIKAETVVKSATSYSYPDILTTAVIVRTRAYRVSYTAYNRMKCNKLINVLCKK